MEKWKHRVDGFLVGWGVGILMFMIVLSIIGSELPKPPAPLVCPTPLVTLAEYKTVVTSLDLCNERLHEVVVDAYENDYEIQQNAVVERFQPDTPEAEDIETCRSCSANCEEALQWCYFYRSESCFCLDEEEEW